MGLRRRVVQSSPLEVRLAEEAISLREQAKKLPHGPQREALLRRAQQNEVGAHMTEWLTSPGLQPPE
nr:hypothetical protein [Bradyrhizobium sp. 179]